MSRAYQIFGEFIVRVRGGAHLPPLMNTNAVDLGLTNGPVKLIPRFVHQDVHTDDFGPDIPAETMMMLAEVKILMTLVHYDATILDVCVQESLAGGSGTYFPDREGTMPGAGKLMGGGVAFGESGNHYIRVNLVPASAAVRKWRFTTCYLDTQPLVIPLGSERSLVELSWRAIPYATMNPTSSLATGEVTSAGVVLWDHLADDPA